MRVIVDGIIFQMQSHGGISRLYSETLPRICELDSSLDVTLLTAGNPVQRLPQHGRMSCRRLPRAETYLRPSRVFRPLVPLARRLLVQVCVGTGRDCIWHSTYYSLPGRWHGWQVVTVADLVHERAGRFYQGPMDDRFREQKRRCIAEADAVICISEATRKDLLSYYDVKDDAVAVVPLAAGGGFKPLGKEALGLYGGAREPFLLYVGARARHKNFGELARAYATWKFRNEISLVVAGADWSPEEMRQLVDLQIEERVHLLTGVGDDELCQLYNRASALVYPSLYEGFGIPLLEAMACACPVVASHIPSTIEVAGDCPVYFTLGEAESLHSALDTAIWEGRSSARVGRGLERAASYSWDETAKGTLKVYRAVSQC